MTSANNVRDLGGSCSLVGTSDTQCARPHEASHAERCLLNLYIRVVDDMGLQSTSIQKIRVELADHVEV